MTALISSKAGRGAELPEAEPAVRMPAEFAPKVRSRLSLRPGARMQIRDRIDAATLTALVPALSETG